VTLGGSLYERYYPLRRNEALMRAADAAAVRNPFIPRLEVLNGQLAEIREQTDKRATLVEAEARRRQAALAQAGQLKLGLAAKRAKGSGGVSMKDTIELMKLLADVGKAEATAYTARFEDMDITGKQAFANSFGTTGALPTSLRGSLQKLAVQADRLKKARITDPQVLESALGLDAKDSSTILAAVADDDQMAKLGQAAAFRSMLEDGGMAGAQANKIAADLFGITNPDAVSADYTAATQERLKGALTDIIPAGKGEAARLPRVADLVEKTLEQMYGGGGGATGDGGAAYRAELERQKQQKLTPEERAALDRFLGSLRTTGQMPTGPDFEAGRAAYQKAKRFSAFRPEEAKWFDDEFLEQMFEQIGLTDQARTVEEKALARAERTPEQIQREMAQNFVRSVTAAEGLEVVPANFDDFQTPFQMRTYGGALDIVRKEGAAVFDPSAAPEDRTRRLGGKGPLKTRTHRAALRAYQMYRDDAAATIDPQSLSEGIAQLRKQFKGKPEAQRVAVSYFMAMNMVQDNLKRGGSGAPAPAEATPPPVPVPAPPPSPPPPVEVPVEATPAPAATTRGTPRRTETPAPPLAGTGSYFPELDLINQPNVAAIAAAQRAKAGESPVDLSPGESPVNVLPRADTIATYPDPAGPGFVMGQRFGRHRVMNPELQSRLDPMPLRGEVDYPFDLKGEVDYPFDLKGRVVPVANASMSGGPQPRVFGVDAGSRQTAKVIPAARPLSTQGSREVIPALYPSNVIPPLRPLPEQQGRREVIPALYPPGVIPPLRALPSDYSTPFYATPQEESDLLFDAYMSQFEP
jgi:hypothetical protein